jgi:hypothetical protein
MTRSHVPSLLSFFLLACAGQTAQVQNDPPPTRAEPVVAQPSVPADFAIAARGGPVAAWMGAGMTFTHTRIAPSSTPGAFDVVVEESVTDEMGHEQNLHETRRVQIEPTQIEALYTFIASHRSELQALCQNPDIMDGGFSQFIVRAAGEDLNFQCINSTTPAFTELQTRYGATLQAALGT